MKYGARFLVFVVTAFLCAACSTGNNSTTPTPSQTNQYFSGTPEEYWAAMISCYRQHGIEAEPNGDGGIRTFSNLAPDEYNKISLSCRDPLGEPLPEEMLNESQYRERYQWRADQYRCLVDHGYLTGEPMSFDQYRALTYKTTESWRPLSLVDKSVYSQSAKACPDSEKAW